MDIELPSRIFREKEEPEVKIINNYCKMSILELLANEIPSEYNEVKADPIFAHIIAIGSNQLGFSGKLIHNFLCRQLDTAKRHELWFVFARRPMRFSMQEFHAVTGLKFHNDIDCNLEEWEDDKGFCATLLGNKESTTLQKIKLQHIKEAKSWTRLDRKRLVYLVVIAGILLPMDEKTKIADTYIKLLMDFDKLRAYPWGLHSFDFLLSLIKYVKENKKLTRPNSYSLHGFTYALQIWIMEVVPDLGDILGKKVTADGIVFPRCSNWRGSGYVSYEEVKQLEAAFRSQNVLHSCISFTENMDVILSDVFVRVGEMRDERIDAIIASIRAQKNWTNQIWSFKESVQTTLSISLQKKIDTETKIGNGDSEVTDKNGDTSSASPARKGKKKRFQTVV